MIRRTALISVSVASARRQFTLQDRGCLWITWCARLLPSFFLSIIAYTHPTESWPCWIDLTGWLHNIPRRFTHPHRQCNNVVLMFRNMTKKIRSRADPGGTRGVTAPVSVSWPPPSLTRYQVQILPDDVCHSFAQGAHKTLTSLYDENKLCM